MAFNTSAAASILNQLTGRAAVGLLPSCYMGFSSTTPADDGTNFTEPSGGSYERILIGIALQPATIKMGDPADRHIENDKIIYGAETTAPWSNLYYWGLLYK